MLLNGFLSRYKVHNKTVKGDISKYLRGVDVVKMDIEGGEKDILQKTPTSSFRNVSNVFIEYHGCKKLVTQYFTRAGFSLQIKAYDRETGMVLAKRKNSLSPIA